MSEHEPTTGGGFAGRKESPGSTEDNPTPGDEMQPSYKVPVTGVSKPYKT